MKLDQPVVKRSYFYLKEAKQASVYHFQQKFVQDLIHYGCFLWREIDELRAQGADL